MAEDNLDLDIEIELELARARRRKKAVNVKEAIADPFRGVNNSLAFLVGIPADAGNAIAGMFDLDVEDPVMGQKFLQRQLAKIGVGTAPAESEFLFRAGESIGAAAGPTGVVGAIGRFGKQIPATIEAASGPVAAAGREIVRSFQQAPRAFVAGETTAAAGGGVGAATAQEFFPGNPIAEMGGEIAGALTPAGIAAAAPAVGRQVSRIPGVKATARAATTTARVLRNQVASVRPMFSEAGQKRLAGKALLEIAEDPKKVKAALRRRSESPDETRFTVAQQSGDRGMMTLEKSAIAASAQNERTYADMADITRAAMEREASDLAGPGQPMAPRQILDAQVDRLEELLDANVASAQQSARNAIDDMGGINVVARQQANRVVSEKLDGALTAARDQEREIWDLVPQNAQTSSKNTLKTYNDIVSKRARTADPEDIPEYVHAWLKPDKTKKTELGDTPTLGEIKVLRSRMLEDLRDRKLSQTKRKVLGDLQSALLEDMGLLPDAAITRAREFSDMLNTKFTEGTVGNLLGFGRKGRVGVDPALALEGTIGRRGAQASVNAKALMRAAESSKTAAGDQFPDVAGEVQAAMSEHIQQRFMRDVMEQGAIVPGRAERFLGNNAELLQDFPQVRQQLEKALMTQGRVADVTAAAKSQRATLHDKNRSVSALYLGAKPSKEINAILEVSPNKVDGLKDLWKRMEGDPAGEAGLKAAFVREMFGRAEMAKLSTDGVPGIDARKLRRDFNTNAKAAQEAGWLNKGEVERLDFIVDSLQRLESNTAKSRNLKEIIDLPLGSGIVDLLVRMTAARAGAQGPLSGSAADLQTAGFAAGAARRFTAQLPGDKIRAFVAEAAFNPELWKDLVSRASTPAEVAKVNRRLNAWLINLGVDREEEQQ